jgi:hypothetical protein
MILNEQELVYGIDALGQTVRARPSFIGSTGYSKVKRHEFRIDDTYRGFIDDHRCLFFREVESIEIQAIFVEDEDGNSVICYDDDDRSRGELDTRTFETLGREKIFIGIADTKVHTFMGDDRGFFRTPLPNVFHSDFTVCMGDQWLKDHDEDASLPQTLEKAIVSMNESVWNHDIVADYPPVWDQSGDITPLDSYLWVDRRNYIMEH